MASSSTAMHRTRRELSRTLHDVITKLSPPKKVARKLNDSRGSASTSRQPEAQAELLLELAPVAEAEKCTAQDAAAGKESQPIISKIKQDKKAVKGKKKDSKIQNQKKEEVLPLPGDEAKGTQCCEYCNKSEVEVMIECECCQRWSCLECQNMSMSLYNIFGNESNHAHWFCKACEAPAIEAARVALARTRSEFNSNANNNNDNESSQSVSLQLQQLISDVRMVKKEIVEVKTEVKIIREVKKTYAQAAGGSTSSVLDGKPRQVPQSGSRSGAAVSPAGKVTLEEIDIEKRRSNFIVYNLPESTAEIRASRDKDDYNAVKCLISSGLEISGVKVRDVTRLGGIRQQRDKPRVVLVRLENDQRKNEILFSARKLRRQERWSETYIAPDLTQAQRSEKQDLWEELKRRRNDGETNIFILNGRIVSRRSRHHESKEDNVSEANQGQNCAHEEAKIAPSVEIELSNPEDQNASQPDGAVGGASPVRQ